MVMSCTRLPLLSALLLFTRLVSAQAVLEGTWEGTFEGTRAPTFLTLHLTRGGERLSGSLHVLGKTIPLQAVEPTESGVHVTVAPNLSISAEVSDGRMVGTLIERDQRFPLRLVHVPPYPTPSNRVEAWSQDLDALVHRFLPADRSFTPAQRERFVEVVDELRNDLPAISDSEVVMRMASAVSLAGNGHTRLYLLRNRTEWRRLPVRLWWFTDGAYIVRATPEHRRLLGCRVDTVDRVPARLVRDRVSIAFPANPSWRDYKSVYFMTSPEALHGVGITRDMEKVELALSGCATTAATLQPLPLEKSGNAVEAWWDLSPLHRAADREWAHALDEKKGDEKKLPLYLRNPARHYWFEYLPDTKVLYFHYSRSSDMTEEKTNDFAKRLLAAFDEHDVQAFVLDLRFNTGGNLNVARELMAALQERTKSIPRFVITGRATFSAGITHAASWRMARNVTFVGEEAGDVLDFWSEGGNIVLPNSGLYAHFANAFHSYSTAPCPKDVPCFLDLSASTLEPDVPVSSSWAEYAARRDVALEAILARLR
jgi:hypothetical protein